MRDQRPRNETKQCIIPLSMISCFLLIVTLGLTIAFPVTYLTQCKKETTPNPKKQKQTQTFKGEIIYGDGNTSNILIFRYLLPTEYISKDEWCDPLDLSSSSPCVVPSPNYYMDLTTERYVFEFNTKRFNKIMLLEKIDPPYVYFYLYSDSFRQLRGPSDVWTQFSLTVNYQRVKSILLPTDTDNVNQLFELSNLLFVERGLYAPTTLNTTSPNSYINRRKLPAVIGMKSKSIGGDWEETIQGGKKTYLNTKTGVTQDTYPTSDQINNIKTLKNGMRTCSLRRRSLSGCISSSEEDLGDTGDAAGDALADGGGDALVEGGGDALAVVFDIAVCFPGDALVTCKNGVKQMRHIQLYDECIDGDGEYSQIYMISHADDQIVNDYFEIKTDNNHVLYISKGHFMIANDNHVRSENVKIGDTLITGKSRSIVRQINTVKKRGAFNPITESGSLMVNNVAALCVSDSFLDSYIHEKYIPYVSQKLLTVPFKLSNFKESWKCMHRKIGPTEMTDNLYETTKHFLTCVFD